jgi:PAS domain S-box-containing protein
MSTPRTPTTTQPHDRSFLNGGGELGARIRAYDWTRTPLGPPERWPVGLKTAIRIMLTSRQAMWIGWGPELTYVYNDAYKAIIGGKHPEALGQPASVVWREIWDDIAPMLATAMGGDQGTYVEAQLLIMERNGYQEETYYTFSYSPIPDDEGNAGGIICANTDDTERVVRERQLKLLRQLAASSADARTVVEACELSGGALRSNPQDVPFALIYRLDPAARQLSLAAAAGIEPGHPAAPLVVGADERAPWPVVDVLRHRNLRIVNDLESGIGVVPPGPWDRSPQQAVILPLAARGQHTDAGLVVLALNPYRRFDDAYRGFVDLVTGQISTNLANATAYEDERRRADMLAELDRTKTAFFSNVSHEFRTPLTLMLGPIEDLLAQPAGELATEQREVLTVVHRNGLRLAKLVNNLLDFSRIEASRVRANYESTDLSALTTDLASVFRSAIERAGVRLVVDCPALPDHVYVDREMWEKVVMNLVSNALKFTFEGEIVVRLRWHGDHVTLTVSDTGTGIAPAELPHVFERFHRVHGARARTHEGTGIGLALAQELVRLHGGRIGVESVVDRSTTFTVSIPTGSAHLPAEWVSAPRSTSSRSVSAQAYVNEAVGWVSDRASQAEGTGSAVPDSGVPRILLADDNADMREYVSRLLSDRWHVESVPDGKAALEAVRERPPHLVLADVMMPGLDGFELLEALRTDPSTSHIPVVLLSARAGEGATLEGISAGADDYLVKPFTARDLLARVEAQLNRAREGEALRDRSAQIEALINKAPVGVYLVDQDFRIVQVNPIAAPVFGDIPDLIGRDFGEVIHQLWMKEYADELVALFRHTLETGEPYATDERAEFRIDRGITEYYEWRIDRISLPDRRHGVVCYFREISAQVLVRQAIAESEARFRRLAEDLEEANRMKDEFLATLSHELRTPLNAVLGWAHMLRVGAMAPAVKQRALESLERNARVQAQLVEDLLDVSRIISGKLSIRAEVVDLAVVIAGAMDAVRPGAIAKGVGLHLQMDPDWQVLVTGDSDRLQQIIWNLLSNAVKFSSSGGRVDTELNHHDEVAEIVVTDRGEGIDPGFLPHVFERFRQADSTPGRKHGGLGLGLAITRYLSEAHGGTVSAESAGRGHGATFRVQLPIRERSRRIAAADGGAAVSECIFAGARALIVDDEADARELLRFILEAQGAEVTTARSAGEALYLFGRSRYDILIADIGMPEQDGNSLIRAIRSLPESEGGHIPAIAVTAYASLRERDQALEAGYGWHLSKPVDPEQLLAAVTSAVRRD